MLQLPSSVSRTSVMGSGAHSTVFRGVWRGAPVAIKCIPKKNHNRDQWITEVDMMRMLMGGPHLPRYYAHEETSNSYCILMELMEGTPGEKIVHRARAQPPREKELRQWGHDALQALAYCHERDIVFNDVKPENMILREGPKPGASLIDLGLCRYPYMYAGMPIGTPMYFSPEKFDCRNEIPSDVWALGVALYLLACGEHPFSQKQASLMGVREDILYKPLAFDQAAWTGITRSFQETLALMLCKDDALRITAARCRDRML